MSNSSSNKLQNNFNLLRFTFAALVIVSHVPELMYGDRSHEILTQIFGSISFGELAVDSFFVISGYLIVKSWSQHAVAKDFIEARLLRIVPGFVVSSLVCALVVAPIYADGGGGYFQSFHWGAYLKSLLTLKSPDTPSTFPGTHYAVVNGAVWSIAYEFKCYLLVFACGLFGVFRKKWPWVYLTAMTVLVYLLMSYGLISDWRYSDARCLMEFMIGGCYYLYKDKIAWNLKLAIFAALVLVVGMTSKHLAELFVGTCWGYLIIYFANSAKGLLAFNSLPDVSYGTYLYAWPINKVIIWYWPDMNLILAVLIVLVLSVWVGWVSWEFVELPMLRMKGRAAKRVAVGAS